MNSRLDTIQAAILIEKLKVFPDEILKRNELAEVYNIGLSNFFKLPNIIDGHISAWAQYTLTLESRHKIQKLLKDRGIPSAVYYPAPLSRQRGYSHYPASSSGLKISEYLADHVLSIPMHPYMEEVNANYIIKTLLEFKELN